MTSFGPDIRINIDRLLDRLAALAAVNPIDGTAGCSRLALTDHDKAGRDLVVSWMRDLDLDISIDGVGNVVATLPGEISGPAVMCGSHIDTVPTGGRYDGNLGVLGGLEVIETLRTAGVVPHRPIAVGFFTNEEGARFQPDMLGSLVYVGGMALEEAHDITGIWGKSVGDELERIGYLGTAPLPASPPSAYVELHIEQGPVLEAEGSTIGALTGVQGISWTEFTLTGQSNHAGTTPMALRHDPGLVAYRTAAFVRDLALELGHPQVGTVGRIELDPNLVNVVPATATFTVDIRNTSNDVLLEAERRVAEFLRQATADEGVTVESRKLARFDPVDFDPSVIDMVESAAVALGHSVKRMPSGAGHDAQMLARVCPTGMIFVPSHEGVSHNPAEHTDPSDIEAGANVLLHVLMELAAK